MKKAAYSPFYSRWIAELWEQREFPPPESLNCDHCTMVSPPAGVATRDPGPFLPELKCCTYFPFLPNFTLGALLKEGSGLAKERLQKALANGRATPLGLFPSQARVELEKSLGTEAFGKTAELLCPFFVGSARSCSIWSHRPGVCASYFCVSARGQEQWQKHEARLNAFEWTLAHEALWRVGFTMDETEEIEKTGGWFEYSGRKEELYRLCHEKALEVSPSEIEELLGETLAL